MAPRGAPQLHATPGLDPTALITRLLLLLLLILPSTSSLPLGDDSEPSDDHIYYMNDDVRCLRCPAGYYVKAACTQPDTLGVCVPCPAGSFTEDLTGMSECLTCRRCRDDQDQVSACKSTKDTVCHCKKGTYCAPNQPCEICLNCTPSCPEDQFLLAPCNSTSDIQCGSQSDSTDNNTSIIIAGTLIPLLLLILALILVVVLMKRREGSKLFGKPGESEDSSTQLLPSDIKLQFKEDITADAKDYIITRTFDVIVVHGPVKEFDQFMRQLGLSDRDIERAELDNARNANSQHYAMLRMWHQQNPFDVNLILKALCRLKMDKTAQTITRELLREDLYIQQVQD
ncbi:tumor necrosis factor receptor superfamily member 26-like isoform X2 [Hyperolius riggenbachi]|uniref:tumor necrosis factor receptor superfamily member 26-like isoform X2 n=1 Tax=Hyperolius riggenbachi TaxID=752182 RepID=UPI0035A3887E